ncbi:MAG TPA: phosphoserine phosphatase SerB [Candidatus Parabacteroides intestinipullorum]|uniref:Phosphoserine phosphatase n=1 Tax=Candidatus Parabacteroides intestinipullorum TaxID=2838723 RepID=A0A9D1XB84_9BACT|nr:phosphoserine phosphatase SerB [Candidatus Parabacteroides intestinipullorum]
MLKKEIILININGTDRPGVTAAITEILAKNNAVILDIGQADIHNHLSLGILFQSVEGNSGDIMKELLFKAYELDVNIRFNPISEADYSEWVNLQGKNRYIITILGRKLTAKQIASVSRVVAEQGMNIDDIKRLTGRIPLDENARTPKASVEFSVRGTPLDKEKMKANFMKLASELEMDISFQQDSMYRRMRRLICFDMDSTLIQTEVIDELAMRAGVGDQVKAITEAAMRGEIDFKESFRQRCALLKGLDVSVMREIAENLPITEGVDRLMYVLKKVGFKIAILSGGFTYFGNYLKQRYHIDYVYANELEIENGKLTGNYVGDIVDGNRKAELLRLIAQVENVDIRQTVAVGDGANDLPMISIAGLGIAFHAKPKVKENANQSISTIGLDGILYFLGYKDSYIEE